MRLLVIAAAMLLATEARADDLALRRVMLSAAGVGYFEFVGEADGATPLTLDVKRAEVDDVLASLVVFDGAGHLGTVTLPGADAAPAAFADLPFAPAALRSARDLLNALAGTELTVRGPRPMSGRLLHAETVTEPTGTHSGVPRTRVTLLTAEGVQQFVLEDAEAVQVAAPALRGRIDRAVAALRGQPASDLRRLTLHVPGAGRREVHVGYVAVAPLWKATYRLLLPGAEGQQARLQAWAVLENDGVTDWNGVDLTLQYGNPVTFRQALYRSYYVQRPDVPVEVLGRILPDVDVRAHAAALAPAGKAVPMPMNMALAAPPPLASPEPAQAPSEAADTTLFHLPAPVTLPPGQTATLPFLDRRVPAVRIGLAQEGWPHPLAAIRLTNDTGASLPAGVLTLYDDADAAGFAGDARLGGLPPGETRLLAFAEDLRTTTDWRIDAQTRLIGISAAGGVLRLRQRDRWTARVTLVAPAAEARHLLVEIPRRPGTLVPEGDLRPSEETAAAWRFAVDLRAGETRTLVVHVDRTTEQATALLQDEPVLARVLGEQALEPAARAALQHIADLRAALAAHRAEQQDLATQRAALERDEDRLRKNLAAVPTSDALHGKLVQALGADEAQLAALATRADAAAQGVHTAEIALQQAILTLSL